MSKLDDLINKLSPDGVEYHKTNSLCEIKTGKGITSKDSTENGEYPIISGGKTPMGYYDKFNREGNTVTVSRVGANAGFVMYMEERFYLNDKCFSIIPFEDIKETINTKYLYYYFKYIENDIIALQSEGGVPTINTQKVGNLKIPVPPLEVQNEIVRILEKLTLLEVEIEADLKAEIEVRRKQYEYYKSLFFEDNGKYKTKHITDIALVKARVGWQRLTTAEYLDSGDYYLITGTDFKNGIINFDTCHYVTKERYDMDTNIQVHKDDILITKDGTLGKVAMLTDEPTKLSTLNSGVFNIHVFDKEIYPRYIYHFFTSKTFTDFVLKVKTGSTIPHLTQQGLITLNIPIPPFVEQKKIANTLDRFELLCNDFTDSLNAEIAERHKQYEFYRDKLLTFNRKEG